jgi:phosphoglycolate phosphatase
MDGVIFDKDGTLFDFRQSWGVWAAGLLRHLADADEDRARRMGEGIGFHLDTGRFEPDSPVIAATADEIALGLLPHLPGITQRDLVHRMNALATHAPMIPAADLHAVLTRLRGQGLKIGLATNDAEVAAHAHLRAQGIDDFFDFVAGADSGHGAKPDPGMLRAFLRAQGLSPARVAMVGDSRHDLIAGRAAGMATVAVLTGIAETDELAPLADVVLPDIAHLPGWIDRRRGG